MKKYKRKKLFLGIAGKDIVVKNAPDFSDNTNDKQNVIIPLIATKIRQGLNKGTVKAKLSNGDVYKLNWTIENSPIRKLN